MHQSLSASSAIAAIPALAICRACPAAAVLEDIYLVPHTGQQPDSAPA